jgi:hypothetical protein
MPEERDIGDFVTDFVDEEIKDNKIKKSEKAERMATLTSIVEIRYREKVKLDLLQEQVDKSTISRDEADKSIEKIKHETSEKLERYRSRDIASMSSNLSSKARTTRARFRRRLPKKPRRKSRSTRAISVNPQPRKWRQRTNCSKRCRARPNRSEPRNGVCSE